DTLALAFVARSGHERGPPEPDRAFLGTLRPRGDALDGGDCVRGLSGAFGEPHHEDEGDPFGGHGFECDDGVAKRCLTKALLLELPGRSVVSRAFAVDAERRARDDFVGALEI